ncbi:hypothetical protein [Halobacillus campisalis]|uniref:Uncharacterized protein n=1 Tax=Halobacillus campisalis TaxID=435909 RepID=A0ABW2K271_9BACI|nr:hypothetical protein [Halobacillus campisalis]
MKRWLLTILAFMSVSIWTVVLIIFFNLSEEKVVSSHSQSIPTSLAERQYGVERINMPEEGKEEERRMDTVIGETVISKIWVDDMSEDGRVSIDTLLKTLELDD